MEFPPFRPHPLLRSRDVQTLYSVFAPGKHTCPEQVQHEVTLDDGDRIVLHDAIPDDWQLGGRIALLVHGMTGSHKSGYMPRVAGKLCGEGVRTFSMDLRGCGAGFQLARKTCNAGSSGDVAAAFEFLAKLCPGSPAAVVGFSMGGNIVLKMLGEACERPPGNVDRAVTIAPPIDLTVCAKNLRRFRNRVYEKGFLRWLIEIVDERRRETDFPVPDLIPKPRRLVEFDDLYTAPLGGFADAWDYYEKSSAGSLLPKVRVPTLMIVSKDDPIIPYETFENAQLSSAIHQHTTRHGGHMGYIGMKCEHDEDRRWMDWRIVAWVCG